MYLTMFPKKQRKITIPFADVRLLFMKNLRISDKMNNKILCNYGHNSLLNLPVTYPENLRNIYIKLGIIYFFRVLVKEMLESKNIENRHFRYFLIEKALVLPVIYK